MSRLNSKVRKLRYRVADLQEAVVFLQTRLRDMELLYEALRNHLMRGSDPLSPSGGVDVGRKSVPSENQKSLRDF